MYHKSGNELVGCMKRGVIDGGGGVMAGRSGRVGWMDDEEFKCSGYNQLGGF